MLEAFGPVVTDRNSGFFIAAGKKSNNTAELSARIEALMYIYAQREETVAIFSLGDRFSLRSDSTYEVGLSILNSPRKRMLLWRNSWCIF